MKQLSLALLIPIALLMVLPIASASYTIIHFNTTAALNLNGSAQVSEVYTVQMTNASLGQYESSRVSLNLTLSQWQQLLGPALAPHILNPKSGVYGFKFIPGPPTQSGPGLYTSSVLMTYIVQNVTSVNQTAPRTYQYTFNNSVFNFEHAASGQVLNPQATFTIVLPGGSSIISVYPIPDSPSGAFTKNYQNVTEVSWDAGEPLSKFALQFVVKQSLGGEVVQFFTTVYKALGIFAYVIIIAVILLFILYTYLKAEATKDSLHKSTARKRGVRKR